MAHTVPGRQVWGDGPYDGGMIIKLIAAFVDGQTGKPLTGEGLTVRFCDRDMVKDDVLGESLLSGGEASVITTELAFKGLLGIGERTPDLYCEVRDHGKAVYRTPVAWNSKVVEKRPGGEKVLTHHLGTFRVTPGEGLADAAPAAPKKPGF